MVVRHGLWEPNPPVVPDGRGWAGLGISWRLREGRGSARTSPTFLLTELFSTSDFLMPVCPVMEHGQATSGSLGMALGGCTLQRE